MDDEHQAARLPQQNLYMLEVINATTMWSIPAVSMEAALQQLDAVWQAEWPTCAYVVCSCTLVAEGDPGAQRRYLPLPGGRGEEHV